MKNRLICLVRGGCTIEGTFNAWTEGTIHYVECTRCGRVYSADLAKIKTLALPEGINQKELE